MSPRPVLILAPGLLCDTALWRHQIDHLGDLADVLVADFGSQDSMEAMAASVLAMTEGPFSLAGLSMGGYVSLEVMRRAPERVERLALLDTSARADTPEQTSRRRGLIELANKGNFKGVTPRLLPLFLHPERLDDAELVNTVISMTERVGRDAFLQQQQAILERSESRPSLAQIAVPTVVICGRDDALTPLEWSEEIASGVPGAVLLPIEQCAHLATLEQPAAVTAALRYWMQL